MQASQADIDCLQMLSQLFATHQKLKSLRFKQFHFSFVNSKIWKETSESRNFAAIKQFNKMKKKFIILPVVAMLMVCGFSACSQDDDLLEYDLGNDEVATLAKRSMPRNGEAIIPPITSSTVGQFEMEPSFYFTYTEYIGNDIVTLDTTLVAKVVVTVNKTYPSDNPHMASYTGTLSVLECPTELDIDDTPSITLNGNNNVSITLRANFRNASQKEYSESFTIGE